MKTIYAKHLPYETGHLADVCSEMQLTGSPTIRVVEHQGDLMALEGSHRLASAHHLGLPVKVIVLTPDVSGCDAFFEVVKPTLPAYEFETVLGVREDKF